jgi:hypothetical protein
MFELIENAPSSEAPHAASGPPQMHPAQAKVMRSRAVNNLWKTSEKFSLPRVEQIQLPICHLPKPPNFRNDALMEFPCETFDSPSGKNCNKFQSNIL